MGYEDLSTLPPMIDVLRAFEVRLHGDATQQIRCPVHEDRSPSARYYADDGHVHCFVCGRSWNVLQLVIARLKVDRDTARHWLTARFGVVTPNTAEQVKRGILSRPQASLGEVHARIDYADSRIRELAPDRPTALRWWTALDVLRGELKTPGSLTSVTGKLGRLLQRMGV